MAHCIVYLGLAQILTIPICSAGSPGSYSTVFNGVEGIHDFGDLCKYRHVCQAKGVGDPGKPRYPQTNVFHRACGGMDGCNNDVCSQLLLVSRNKDDSSTVLHSGIKFDWHVSIKLKSKKLCTYSQHCTHFGFWKKNITRKLRFVLMIQLMRNSPLALTLHQFLGTCLPR